MKSEVKNIGGNKREIAIEVIGDTIKNKFEEVFQKISNEAKVPGFRPGHIPRDILEKNFSALAHEQVLKELVPELYNQAIEKENLEVIDLPSISEVKLERNSISFKAIVETAPEIKLSNYKGIKLSYRKIAVSADDIKRSLDSLKEARKIQNLDDSYVKGLGYPNLAELEKALERQIFLQKENLERQNIEEELVKAITQGLDFKVPEGMVKRQLEDLVRQTKVDLALRGLPREKIDAEEKKLTQELEPQARNQVKVYLVLAEIAKKENIPQDEQMPRKVMEFLLREADWKEVVS